MWQHWFDYLLCPEQLTAQLETAGVQQKEEVSTLLKELLTNLLNSQNLGFFTENPFELWFCEAGERKVPVMRNLCLQLISSMDWRLGELERVLPPPLLLYILQAYIQSQPESGSLELNKVSSHLELSLAQIAQPGPVLHSLILLHRWILRTYMQCRTPQRLERTSNVMVPGVKRDPALIFRDQTNSLVLNLFPTSLRFLTQVLQSGLSPASLPSPKSFSATQLYSVPSWSHLSDCEVNQLMSLVAYDLGSCYFFNEDYAASTECFSAYFKHSSQLPCLLTSDIQESKLTGYLQCLGLAPPAHKNNNVRFLESAKDQLENLIPVLEEDTFTQQISDAEIDVAELYMRRRGAEQLTSLHVHTIVRRTLRGLPLTVAALASLENMGEAGLRLLEDQILKVRAQGSSKDIRLANNLVQKLVLFGILRPTSCLVKDDTTETFCLQELEERSPSLRSAIPLCETFNLKKICKYNAAVQLLETFKVPLLTGLAVGLRPASQVTQRWHMEDHYHRFVNKSANLNNFDDISIILSKVNQLKKIGRWDEATELLLNLTAEIASGDRGLAGLGRVLQGDQLCVDLLRRAEQEDRRGPELVDPELHGRALAALCNGESNVNLLQELSLNLVLEAGDWEAINRAGLRGGVVPNLVKALTSLLTSLTSNNPQLLKKMGRDVWELVNPYVSSAANKRKDQDQRSSPIKERNQVQRFLERIRNPELALLALSLLATLFNVARDDPSTELLSMYPSVWPTGLATNQSIQDKLVQDILQSVLTAYLARFPKDPNILQTAADLQFANSNYRSALSLYVEMVAARTDFFQHPIEQGVLSDCYVNRLVRCCTELGRLTQAVVLSQFCQEPNYAQVFKYLEDRESSDAADSLYSCIWDMSILEFAMSLHTRRGEVAKRRHVLSCIMQLELNTNNEQEIKREAANIRKSIFFRSLAAQLFTAA